MGGKYDWSKKRDTIVSMLGDYSGPEIAEAVGVTVASLRWYCQNNNISLRLKSEVKSARTKEANLIRSNSNACATAAPRKVPKINLDDYWKIPSTSGVQQ